MLKIKNQMKEKEIKYHVRHASRYPGVLRDREYLKQFNRFIKPEEFFRRVVQLSGYALLYIDDQTFSICEAAIQQNPEAIKFVKDQTPMLCFMAVMRGGNVIKYVKNQTYDLCLIAIEQNYENIRFITKHQPEYKQLCLIALNNCGFSIECIDGSNFDFDTFIELCEVAVRRHGCAIASWPINELKTNNITTYRKLCKIAVQTDGLAIEFIGEKIFPDKKDYLEICISALKQNEDAYVFISKTFRNMLNMLRIVDVCIGFHSLRLPSYVLLEIIKWILAENTIGEKRMIECIIRINEN